VKKVKRFLGANTFFPWDPGKTAGRPLWGALKYDKSPGRIRPDAWPLDARMLNIASPGHR